MHEIAAHAASAAVLGHLIERIGAYAGFASVIGLAVMSALYFSQARDVKRLRDWAGRAPERSLEAQTGRTPEAAAGRPGQPTGVQRVGPARRGGAARGAQPPAAQPAAPAKAPAEPATAAPAAAGGKQEEE